VRLLTTREHSRLELAQKLASRGHAEAVIAAQLDRLEAEGLLDEGRFTEAFVRSRQSRGQGPLRIRMELRQRGVEDSLIEAYLDERSAEWQACLRAVHDAKYGATLPSDRKEQARRARFLEFRGFSAEQIRRLLWQNGG